MAAWLGITQAQLSRIEHGPPIRDLDRLIHWATLLRIPAASLWLAMIHGPRSRSARAEVPPTA
jgi:transcriptional regulator with XRE-family HTH domain